MRLYSLLERGRGTSFPGVFYVSSRIGRRVLNRSTGRQVKMGGLCEPFVEGVYVGARLGNEEDSDDEDDDGDSTAI